jgi:hypothetical protein
MHLGQSFVALLSLILLAVPSPALGQSWHLRKSSMSCNVRTECHAVNTAGTIPVVFEWKDFSPQFAAWLSPFLALTAQPPYESNDTWHDLMSLFLTVGSPQLATYSLAMTILNSCYAKRRLDETFSRGFKSQSQELLEDLKIRIIKTLRMSRQ